MKREEIIILAQLLTSIKDATGKLEKSLKVKDMEGVAMAKREILNFQRQVAAHL